MIQSYPDDEFERFAVAVLTMPISNADDRRERFPKELSRRLFPRRNNLLAQQRVAAAMTIAEVPGLKPTSFPPPPPQQAQHTGSQTASSSQASIERDRAPYASSTPSNSRPSFSSMSGSSEEPSSPPSVPIERERKPYTSKPGCGRVYEDSKSSSGSTPTGPAAQTPQPASSAPPPSQAPFGRPEPRQAASTQHVPPAPTSGNSLRRSNSSANAPARPHAGSYSQREHGPPPTSMPAQGIPNVVHTSGHSGMRRQRTNSSGQRFPMRSRSPTVNSQNPYTRSEGNNVNDIPSSYYQSNLYRTGSHTSAIDDEDLSASVGSHGSYSQAPRSASYVSTASSGMNGSTHATSAPRSVDGRKYTIDSDAQRSDWMRRQAAAQEQDTQRYGAGSVPPQRRNSTYEDDAYYDRRRSTHGSYSGWADGTRRFG
jgi:hypothetical protein